MTLLHFSKRCQIGSISIRFLSALGPAFAVLPANSINAKELEQLSEANLCLFMINLLRRYILLVRRA